MDQVTGNNFYQAEEINEEKNKLSNYPLIIDKLNKNLEIKSIRANIKDNKIAMIDNLHKRKVLDKTSVNSLTNKKYITNDLVKKSSIAKKNIYKIRKRDSLFNSNAWSKENYNNNNKNSKLNMPENNNINNSNNNNNNKSDANSCVSIEKNMALEKYNELDNILKADENIFKTEIDNYKKNLNLIKENIDNLNTNNQNDNISNIEDVENNQDKIVLSNTIKSSLNFRFDETKKTLSYLRQVTKPKEKVYYDDTRVNIQKLLKYSRKKQANLLEEEKENNKILNILKNNNIFSIESEETLKNSNNIKIKNNITNNSLNKENTQEEKEEELKLDIKNNKTNYNKFLKTTYFCDKENDKTKNIKLKNNIRNKDNIISIVDTNLDNIDNENFYKTKYSALTNQLKDYKKQDFKKDNSKSCNAFKYTFYNKNNNLTINVVKNEVLSGYNLSNKFDFKRNRLKELLDKDFKEKILSKQDIEKNVKIKFSKLNNIENKFRNTVDNKNQKNSSNSLNNYSDYFKNTKDGDIIEKSILKVPISNQYKIINNKNKEDWDKQNKLIKLNEEIEFERIRNNKRIINSIRKRKRNCNKYIDSYSLRDKNVNKQIFTLNKKLGNKILDKKKLNKTIDNFINELNNKLKS